MRNTYMQRAQDINPDWYIIDAAGLRTGRLASAVSRLLIGKHKPTYTSHVNGGDKVIIINADKIVFTGTKMKTKKYYHHTGHPGGLKETTPEKLLNTHPERVLEKAIKGMLPKNCLGSDMYRNLYVYAGTEHPHTAQQPKELDQDLNSWFVK